MRVASWRNKLAVFTGKYPVPMLAAAAIACAGLLSGCETTAVKPAPPLARAKPAVKPAPPAPAVAAAPAAPNGAHVKVALLAPMTGGNAALGQAMMDAANLAVFDIAGDTFELLPEDTGDTPDGARKAAEQAIAGGAKLILGPVFSASVASVRPVAKAAGVNVVSFSTDVGQAGDNVFVMGFLPSSQVDRVVKYAQARGLARIAALTPDTPYGAASTAALQANATPVATARYASGASDLTPQLETLKAAGGFDALFLPEGGDHLRGIAKALPGAGIDPAHVRLLGTGLWDDPALGQEPALLGGWYAGTAPAARADFEKRFNATYHYAPARLATLAYDATALAIVLAKQAPAGQNPFDKAAIAKQTGFAGVDGIFRFRDDGTIERGLSVLQIGTAGPVVIDPAPKSFMGRTGM